MTGVTEPTLLPEQAALIAALALAETDPTPRNKALVRQAAQAFPMRNRVRIVAVAGQGAEGCVHGADHRLPTLAEQLCARHRHAWVELDDSCYRR